jgi:hypothetical protein
MSGKCRTSDGRPDRRTSCRSRPTVTLREGRPRVSEASRKAVKQDGPPLYGGERKHPGSYPGIVSEALPDGVLIRRADDDQDLALAPKRSAEHDEARVDEIVYEASVIVKAGLPAQVPVPVPWSAPPLAHSVELHSSDARSSGGRPRHTGQRRGSSGPASQLPGLSLLSGPGGRDASVAGTRIGCYVRRVPALPRLPAEPRHGPARQIQRLVISRALAKG